MRLTRRTVVGGMGAHFAQAARGASLRLPRKVRVALIGVDGHPGEVLGPLPQLPDVEITAFAESDPKALARYSKNPVLAGAAKYADFRELFDKEQFDVAAVCNGNHERATVVLMALERKRHVIAEKPLAIETADLERIRKMVERGHSKIVALFPMRYSPSYLALKRIVDSGEIGEVIQMDAQKSYKTSERPAWFHKRATYGGTMPWIGIHMVDLMMFTSGRNLVEAFGYQNHIGFPETGEIENVSGTVFKLDNGGVALLRMDYLRPKTATTHGDDRLRLAGTKGVAEYMEATGVTVISDGRAREVVRDLPPARSLFIEFLDHIYNGKPASLTWPEIYRAHQIVLGARDAMERQRVVRL